MPDPLDFVKNVLSNLILFIFYVFNRRASSQLRFYFDLPVSSRIIGLAAYAIIFIAISISYGTPDLPFAPQLLWIGIFQLIIPVVLIALTFFYKPFRKNFQSRLLWLSLGGAMLAWISSSVISYYVTITQLEANQISQFDMSFFNGKTFLVNLLIVLAFSFYIEIMKQVSTQKTQMQAEIDVAHRIQSDLLPVLDMQRETFHLYGRTEPANEVGGDYCDVVELSDYRLAVAVGDVSGHNVAAGVLMGMLKIAFRTELSYMKDPKQLVGSLNKSMYDHKDKNMFFSFLFILVDPADQHITVVNCGHPPLLHLSANDNSIKEYRTGDVALGLQYQATFNSQTIHYNPNDVFVLLSDGLFETLNADGGELGLEAIQQKLREHADHLPENIYDALMKTAKEFRGNVPQRDDVTVLVLKMIG